MKPLPLLPAAVALLTSLAPPARAQDPEPRPVRVGALEALRILKTETRFAGDRKLVEIAGNRGTPGPFAWRITAWAPNLTNKLAAHTVRGRTLQEPEASTAYFPNRIPDGYFDAAKVRIDSGEAFRTADREAGAARIGFDLLDYRLHCREFSSDPVWTVRLRDAEERVVGIVDLSAIDGRTLRTVWFRLSPDGELLDIEDSAVDGLRTPAADEPAPPPTDDGERPDDIPLEEEPPPPPPR